MKTKDQVLEDLKTASYSVDYMCQVDNELYTETLIALYRKFGDNPLVIYSELINETIHTAIQLLA